MHASLRAVVCGCARAVSSRALRDAEGPTTLGRYELVSSLGSGGMATVYKAFHRALDRTVAIKVIRADLSNDEEFVERFRAEAKTVARMRHPHIVEVHDFDEADGRHFIVMEYLEGGSLLDRAAALRKLGQRIPPLEVARIVGEAADGLAYAHGLGILHRDVKPANILFTRDGRAVVTDFGLAKMMLAVGRTQTGYMMGTPEYMSPEQSRGAPADGRTDVYALGVVAYELLTGRAPYVADSPLAVAMARQNDPLPAPSSLDPRVTPDIEAVLTTALALEPDGRYADTNEFANALSRAIAESGSAAHDTTASQMVPVAAGARTPSKPGSIPKPASAPPGPTTIAITFPSGAWVGVGAAGLVVVIFLIALLLRSVLVAPQVASTTTAPTSGAGGAPAGGPSGAPGAQGFDIRGIADPKLLPRGNVVLRRDDNFTASDFSAGPRAPAGSVRADGGDIVITASEPAADASIHNTHRSVFIADYTVNVPPNADVRILLCFRSAADRQICFTAGRSGTTLESDTASGPEIIARGNPVVPFGGTLSFTIFAQQNTFTLFSSDKALLESGDPKITAVAGDTDLVIGVARGGPGATGGDVRIKELHVFELLPPPSQSGRP